MPMEISARGKRFLQPERFAAKFTNAVETAETKAADAATQASRSAFERKLSSRPHAPARAGRPTTEGEFTNFLSWVRDGDGNITFDRAALEAKAPYAFIQEIGTNADAHITNPSEDISVRSQVGRRLPMTLAWADSAQGPPFRPTRGLNTQQLFLLSGMSDEQGNPFARRRTGRIRREIKGKHFMRDGGFAGYDTLRRQLLQDAKQFLT